MSAVESPLTKLKGVFGGANWEKFVAKMPKWEAQLANFNVDTIDGKLEKCGFDPLSETPDMANALVEYFKAVTPLSNVQPLSIAFADLVRQSGIDVRRTVVQRAVLRFGQQVDFAERHGDKELAATVYMNASSLPSASTVRLLSDDNFFVGDSLFNGSDLSKCFDKNGNQCVLKPINHKEFSHAQYLQELLASRGKEELHYVTSFKLFDSANLKATKLNVNVRKENSKYYMIMPKFSDVLDSLPPVLAGDAVIRLWEQVSCGLCELHELGIAHMDIKPANIGVEDSGDFCIIDVNSAVPFGQPTGSTIAYIPTDKRSERAARRACSNPETDWWMFATTLCEKCCGEKSVDFSAKDLTSEQVMSLLDKQLQDNRDGEESKVLRELRGHIEKAEHAIIHPTPEKEHIEVVPREAVYLDFTSPPRSKKGHPSW